jgi:hypothetical protein
VSATRIGACILAALAFAAAPRAAAQGVIGGAIGYGIYPVAPVLVWPVYPYPYGGYSFPDPLRFTEELPSCYRFGRCTLRDLELFRDRPHRLERLAPAAPDLEPPAADAGPPFTGGRREPPSRAAVAPTPEENIRPAYRGASVPREEFSESGKPR